jgi:Photosynthetic reaction centre cytochrome C subunit
MRASWMRCFPKKNRSLRILESTVTILGVVAALALILKRSDARASTNEKAVAPSGPTVEQGNKNIKVLTGMPEYQLIPTMKFFTVSLGVSCTYCHVMSKDGKMDTAADDKETKRIARGMIKMVLEANATMFHNEPQISCYTCHRGQTVVPKFSNFPVALKTMSPPAAGPQPTATATPALPTADEILSKYAAAIGGQVAIARIKSAVITGTVENASGSTGTFETDQVAPDKGYDSVTTQRGTRVRIVNEPRGWEKNAYGVNELSGQQLEDLKLSLALFGNLNLREQFSKFEVAAKEKINNRDVYVLNATRADQKREHLYFDSESGLLLRRVADTSTMIGIIPEQIDFEDYRAVDDVKLPGTVRFAAVDTQNPMSTRKIDKIALNVPIEDSKFNKPES